MKQLRIKSNQSFFTVGGVSESVKTEPAEEALLPKEKRIRLEIDTSKKTINVQQCITYITHVLPLSLCSLAVLTARCGGKRNNYYALNCSNYDCIRM